jgi:KaiC/GvpD/RAD55 family RecA-like ATPase
VGEKNPSAVIPRIANCESWDQLEEDLRGITKDDLLVVDSISQLASSHESTTLVKRCIEEIRRVGARALFIAQFTKDGNMLGPNEIAHMVDVVCQIPKDKSGMRRLVLQKNRFGSLRSTYFSIDSTGIIQQAFSYGYTVEGPVGNYSLTMYPMNGARYTGIMDKLCEAGFNLERFASCAISCDAYQGGFAEPPDAAERQAFAESHELTWISAEEAADMIENPDKYMEHE